MDENVTQEAQPADRSDLSWSDLDQYLSENFEKNDKGMYKIYDRFSFDELFKFLLRSGFDNEEALYFVLCNCSLSALVFQERIYNKYYLRL